MMDITSRTRLSNVSQDQDMSSSKLSQLIRRFWQNKGIEMEAKCTEKIIE